MLNQLSPEQEKLCAVVRDRWLEIGLSTNTDRKAAEKHICAAYLAGKIKEPDTFVWAESPIGLVKKFSERYDISLQEAWNKISFCYGSHDAGFLSFYDFFREINACDLSLISPLTEASKVCGWFAPRKGICFCSDKPTECRTIVGNRNRHVLHNATGPAIRYADDFEIYALNGVVMKKAYIMTPADKIDLKEVFAEKNADVRRELVAKVGIKRIIDEMNAIIADEVDDYQLIILDIGSSRRPYLRMVNPSTGDTHIEGVPVGIKSVRSALAWRNGLAEYTPPQAIT